MRTIRNEQNEDRNKEPFLTVRESVSKSSSPQWKLSRAEEFGMAFYYFRLVFFFLFMKSAFPSFCCIGLYMMCMFRKMDSIFRSVLEMFPFVIPSRPKGGKTQVTPERAGASPLKGSLLASMRLAWYTAKRDWGTSKKPIVSSSTSWVPRACLLNWHFTRRKGHTAAMQDNRFRSSEYF